MKIELVIKGNAIPKQSAKFANIGGFIKSYQKKEVVNYANYIRYCFLEKYPNHNVEDFKNKELQIHVIEYRKIPKSKSKKFQQQAEEKLVRPITKPDVDNIGKNVKDALNGVCYPDDSQIVKEINEKFYSNNPRLEVFVGDLCQE